MRSSSAAQRAASITGIGELGASALTASVADFKQFNSAHQFGAWLGLVPSQNSSGGKTVSVRSAPRCAEGRGKPGCVRNVGLWTHP